MFRQRNNLTDGKRFTLESIHLNRSVVVDVYGLSFLTKSEKLSLLCINDGQDLEKIPFASLLEKELQAGKIHSVLCVGIHAGTDRKMEYGVAGVPDYLQRGAKAEAYGRFITMELMPWIQQLSNDYPFHETAFAGFSLGGLMALDLVWKQPHLFSCAGVFSGALWWRSKALDDGYEESRDRIMHAEIRKRAYREGQRFFFQAGALDETSDRNGNGIIDSIDDTLDIIRELENIGYCKGAELQYLELPNGRHDVATWGRAFPEFLRFAFPL